MKIFCVKFFFSDNQRSSVSKLVQTLFPPPHRLQKWNFPPTALQYHINITGTSQFSLVFFLTDFFLLFSQSSLNFYFYFLTIHKLCCFFSLFAYFLPCITSVFYLSFLFLLFSHILIPSPPNHPCFQIFLLINIPSPLSPGEGGHTSNLRSNLYRWIICLNRFRTFILCSEVSERRHCRVGPTSGWSLWGRRQSFG